MRKMFIHLARVYFPAFPHKFQHELREFLARGGPGSWSFSRHIDIRARMHQRLKRLRHKPVHDEEVFLDLKLRIKPFEVSGMIIFCAMAQYEILSARWGTDWIGLDKTQALEGGFQCSRLEKTTSNGISP